MGQNRDTNFKTAKKIRQQLRDAQMNQLRHDAATGMEMGILHTKLYVLSYAGLPFKVRLKPETFAMIEDATQLNGDELSFIKVMDESEWESIRESWAEEWNKRRAYRAFDLGEMMPDE